MSHQPENFFHHGSRELQDRADTRRIADRIADLRLHEHFTDDDIIQIGAATMFFLATADAQGQPDCSVKGGEPGFVKVIGSNRLQFQDYDGNGMFRSLGNITVNPAVGLLFVDFSAQRKMRINGRATLRRTSSGVLVEVTVRHIFPNCPRYIPRLELVEGSVYNPRPGYSPPPPAWKAKPDLKDFLPAAQAAPVPANSPALLIPETV